jgi:hypothetical protein
MLTGESVIVYYDRFLDGALVVKEIVPLHAQGN